MVSASTNAPCRHKLVCSLGRYAIPTTRDSDKCEQGDEGGGDAVEAGDVVVMEEGTDRPAETRGHRLSLSLRLL